jgi:hypothetical protein
MIVEKDRRDAAYFGPQGGLTAIVGVPVCALLIIALPGGPVLPPIVSSLPTALLQPDVLRAAVPPPGLFPGVVPLALGLKPFVPGAPVVPL